MLVESLGSGILVGKLRGGRIKNLVHIQINGWPLMLASAWIEIAAAYLLQKEIEPAAAWVAQNVWFIHLLAYGLLFWSLYLNRQERGFKWIFLGILLNFMVIMANGGQMPVDIREIDRELYKTTIERLENGKDMVHRVMDEETRLKLLGDILPLRKPYPFPKSLSMGDIVMIGGIALFIQEKMKEKIGTSTSQESKYSI